MGIVVVVVVAAAAAAAATAILILPHAYCHYYECVFQKQPLAATATATVGGGFWFGFSSIRGGVRLRMWLLEFYLKSHWWVLIPT
jgi:hypothetical protein